MELSKKVVTEMEQRGKWFDYDGARLLVASTNSTAYQERLNELQRPHLRAMRKGRFSNKLARKLAIEAMADTILLGWEGVELNGKPLEYSREAALKALTDYPKFADDVADFAGTEAAFEDEDDQEGAESLKNG